MRRNPHVSKGARKGLFLAPRLGSADDPERPDMVGIGSLELPLLSRTPC